MAIKKVSEKDLDENSTAAIHMEAEFMKKLSHPRIVTCFGLLQSEGNYCMVMELCENGNLANFMTVNQAATVDWAKRMEFAIDIATGMNYLHKLGVIHRDIKLGNIVMSKDNKLV